MGSVPITVLIPAFKPGFLSQLMESLCEQTDRDFSVVVGDDAGPEEIWEICGAFSSRLNLRYFRFEDNLGGRDLAAQWNRCLELVADEWVLMPGDDDALHPECIQQLRSAVIKSGGKHAAYRATLRGIDESDRELYVSEPSGYEESAQRLLTLGCLQHHGTVIEFLFSRKKLQSLGGFVSFPIGWYSDTATWILLANMGGIRGVPDAIVNHRMSGGNLSSHHSSLIDKKLEATLQFLNWIEHRRAGIGVSKVEWANLKSGIIWGARASVTKTHLIAFCCGISSYAYMIAGFENKSFAREVVRLLSLYFRKRFAPV